jgi:hypothetical protein
MDEIISGIDDDLGEAKGCLRDYVKTGLITRSQVETAKGEVAYEAMFEAPNTHPGTSPTTTVRISEQAYNALGEAGVP